MIDLRLKALLFIKDFTGCGGDRLFWASGDVLEEIDSKELIEFPGTIICHDFWLIRDFVFDKTADLPAKVVDLDEFRMAVSGHPELRLDREKSDLFSELKLHGVEHETCSAYRKMFNREIELEVPVACIIGAAMLRMFDALCLLAIENGEFDRFFDVEVPVYRLVQKAMSAGISIDTTGLSDKRREAEFDYFYTLKEYAAKHGMPLETPDQAAIESKLLDLGFDLGGVSVDYVLEFMPHQADFGADTIALIEHDAAKRILSSLVVATDKVRPIVDTFGSRTSRIHVRSPSLQNMPKKYRTIIVAREGCRLGYVDFDQYEVGIMAALSKDAALTELYASGDMYEAFAADHLGLPGARKAAKQLFLSYAYGMSRAALIDAAVSLGADRGRAKSAFRMFTKYEEWKKSILSGFQRDGMVATLQGNHFRRKRAGGLTGKEQRSAVSQVVQGTASLIFKRAILELDELSDLQLLLPMHDAILFEYTRDETVSDVIRTFQSVMTSQLQDQVQGKASAGEFAPPNT